MPFSDIPSPDSAAFASVMDTLLLGSGISPRGAKGKQLQNLYRSFLLHLPHPPTRTHLSNLITIAESSSVTGGKGLLQSKCSSNRRERRRDLLRDGKTCGDLLQLRLVVRLP